MNRLDDRGTYPIREFARLTGVNPVTLRAWERRYGIIRPERTEKGHRFYTDEHIQHVRHILYWLDQGYPIRQVKLLLKDGQENSSNNNDDWLNQQQQVIRAAQHLNTQHLDELWNAGFSSYPLAVYYERCLSPVLHFLRSSSTPLIVTHAFEHLLKRKFGAMLLQQQRHNKGPVLLLATNHEHAEIETLACACALGAAEFRVEYFGPQPTPSDLGLTLTMIPAANVWIHFHPLIPAHQQQWQDYFSHCHVTHFLSGAAPDTQVQHKTLIRLPDQLSRQVRSFITGNNTEKNTDNNAEKHTHNGGFH